MSEENSNFTFYGENLDPYNEDEIRKKPIPIEDQIVLDKNGKQRFHGAFTGGFAAGYWNTVGSEEGWTPSLFKSSRSEKAQKREQRPQDFMDDEDQEEFGIAPKVLRARQEFGGVSRDATRVHGDTLGVAKLLQAATERVGERILRKQGWRHGEGIGPKVSQQEKRETRKKNEAEGKKVYGCSMGPVPTERPTTEDSTDSESDSGVTHAPEDLPACLVKPKTNTFGMGYSGLSRNTVLSGHINLFEPNVMNAPKSGVAGIRGQAFGVGAFEAEDEDIYRADDMSRYDFSLESAVERKRKRRWDQETSKKQKVQEECLEGFKKATKPLATTNYYPPPILPKDFNPKHKAKTSRFSEATVQPDNQHIRQGLGRHDMTAEERSVLLGEAKERVAVTSTPTEPSVSVTEVSEEFHVEPAVLKAGQLNPFTHDASKQLRYRQFLTLAKEGRKEELHKLQPKTMTEWERGRELKEFDTASALFKSGPMDDRFVSSTTLLGSEELPKLEAPKVEATVAAAKMKQFGKLTRTREPWQPCSLLCKRFNVPEPNSGTLVATRRKPGFSVFDFLSAAPQNSHAQQAQEAVQQPEDTSQPSTSVTDVPSELPVENIPLPDTQEATVPEDPNARLDFYKAIFLSSSEDEGEDEPPPPPSPPPPKEPERLRVIELPREEPPPKPRSPPRGVFANLDQVFAAASDIELPPDSYGPTAPTSLTSAPAASVRPTVQLAPPGSRWVEKESSASHKKKHKKHSKKKHSKEDRHSRSRTKRNRSLPSSSKSPDHKEGHPSIVKNRYNESPSNSRNDKSPTSRSTSLTRKKGNDKSVSKSPTSESKSLAHKKGNDKSVSKSPTSESKSLTCKKRNDRSVSKSPTRDNSRSKSPTRDNSRSKSPTDKRKHDKSSESSSYKKKHGRSSSTKKRDHSGSPTHRRSPKSSSHKKRHDRNRSKSPKSKHHKKKHSRSSSGNKWGCSTSPKSLVKDGSSKRRGRSSSQSGSKSPSHKRNPTLNKRPLHKHSRSVSNEKKRHHKKHKKGKKECKHHRKDKSPEVISISSSDEN